MRSWHSFSRQALRHPGAQGETGLVLGCQGPDSSAMRHRRYARIWLQAPLPCALALLMASPAIQAIQAEEAGSGLAAEALPAHGEEADEVVNPWRRSLRLGLFLNQSAARNADSSRDGSIRSTEDAISYRLSLDGSLTWAEGANEVEQRLRLRYGRVKEEDSRWRTNSDEIRYDISGLHFLERPHFLYLSGRVQTSFEEPNGSSHLTPGLTFISAGYGQRHKDIFLPITDTFEVRAGLRAQHRWGRDLSSDEKDIDVGLEARIAYTNNLREGVDWRFEIESFAPFDDLGHMTTWAEIGIDLQISPWLVASLSARAYYETEPRKAESGFGYDSLSLRQEALVGFTWSL
ncbi:MAG: DUF481 domain-containing protein [Planctomycetota bacterium]|nr:MAG: DUF481 domain-containing protein [Planctomycetota bacterium]